LALAWALHSRLSVPDGAYVRELYAQLASENPSDRADAIRGLALPVDTKFDPKPAMRALRSDPSVYVRTEAAEALGMVLQSYEKYLGSRKKLGRRVGPEDRHPSEFPMFEIYVMLLKAMTEDPSADVRAAASNSIWYLLVEFKTNGPPDFYDSASDTARPYVSPGLKDRDARVRHNAWLARANLSPKTASAPPSFRSKMQRNRSSRSPLTQTGTSQSRTRAGS